MPHIDEPSSNMNSPGHRSEPAGLIDEPSSSYLNIERGRVGPLGVDVAFDEQSLEPLVSYKIQCAPVQPDLAALIIGCGDVALQTVQHRSRQTPPLARRVEVLECGVRLVPVRKIHNRVPSPSRAFRLLN